MESTEDWEGTASELVGEGSESNTSEGSVSRLERSNKIKILLRH